MRKNRVLITGSSGFFGKNLAERLAKEGYDTCLIASHQDKKLNIIKVDLTDFKRLKTFIRENRPNIIYHLGGIVNLSRDFKITHKCIDVNTKGALNLLESLRSYVPDRFIFTSTEEVYGKGIIPYKEHQAIYPPSGYAISKVATEYLCRNYAHELGFKLIINRIGTSYGPGDSESRLIPQIIKRAFKNEDILLNSGKKKRDYIYIDDVIDALFIESMVTVKNKHEIINIGGGRSYSLLELVNIVLKKMKSKSKLLIGALPERIGEKDVWLLDVSKAKRLLNWRPKTSLSQGLKKTIEHYQKVL